MDTIKLKLQNGLTSYQIKLIALIIMTIDHIGAYGYDIPAIGALYIPLRIVGRIAAPLFLLMVVESARYTRNRPGFLVRLYLAGVGAGLFTAATNFLFRDTVGIFSPGNILFTLLYTVLYIHLVDGLINAIKEKNARDLTFCISGIAATMIPILLFSWTYGAHSWIPDTIKPQYHQLLRDLFDSFIVSPTNIEYSLLFVLMGVAFYFIRDKRMRCVLFVIFCAVSYAGSMLRFSAYLWPMNGLFSYTQSLMILALPFIMLYNGKRGRENKVFFYVFYPVHRYLIRVAVYLLGF